MYFSIESRNSGVSEQHLLLLPHSQQQRRCAWSIILHSLKHWWSPIQNFPHLPYLVPCFYLLTAKTFFPNKEMFAIPYDIYHIWQYDYTRTQNKILLTTPEHSECTVFRNADEQHINPASPRPDRSLATAILTPEVISELKGLGFPLLQATNLGKEMPLLAELHDYPNLQSFSLPR